ncbi:TMV resistance protein N-like [Pyrus ussuriensis x Pyrus communis]|uniref:TMV resistance protein N-like n=1 Tax=Pyrus ussuriensis x Pyrus communis TaxID=2448454 RepID=A0A5N5IBT5_9ROSA|nr:TMV resistance protein N-like [Pyrus ussuriensis x Pyrus communis]
MISNGWLVERGRKGREVEVRAAERESNVKDREQRGSDGDRGRGESGDGVGGKGIIYNEIKKVEEKMTKVLGVSSFSFKHQTNQGRERLASCKRRGNFKLV